MPTTNTSKIIAPGTQFGRLTVIQLLDKKIRNGRVYLCQCSCGNICEKTAQSLRNDGTKSCGCLAREKSAQRLSKRSIKDLKGQRFGKLVVLEITEQRNRGAVVWKCQCDCGNTVYVSSKNLQGGDTQSCGCLKSKGELRIEQLLQENQIHYQKQFSFSDLKSDKGYPLKYDFYVNDQYLIEFDGEQHFTDNSLFSHDDFEYRLSNDNKKTQYALEHNIPLLRIPYYKLQTLTIDDLIPKN